MLLIGLEIRIVCILRVYSSSKTVSKFFFNLKEKLDNYNLQFLKQLQLVSSRRRMPVVMAYVNELSSSNSKSGFHRNIDNLLLPIYVRAFSSERWINHQVAFEKKRGFR